MKSEGMSGTTNEKMNEQKSGSTDVGREMGEDIKDRILYEDNHIIAVNKRCSEIVQSDKTGDTPLLEVVRDYIKKRDGKPGNVFLGTPHRLDRPTSGIVLFAKTGKGLSRLSEMFKEKQIRKIYWVVLDAMPPEHDGELQHMLTRDRKKNKSLAQKMSSENSGSENSGSGNRNRENRSREKAKPARLSYRVISASDNYYLVEVDLQTGRHHQIRAQFAELGCHVKGDIKYGARRTNRDGGIHLHARRVEFIHPVRKELVTISAPPPEDPLWDHFRKL